MCVCVCVGEWDIATQDIAGACGLTVLTDPLLPVTLHHVLFAYTDTMISPMSLQL